MGNVQRGNFRYHSRTGIDTEQTVAIIDMACEPNTPKHVLLCVMLQQNKRGSGLQSNIELKSALQLFCSRLGVCA